MVMLTPALQAIIHHFPDCEIHLLTSPDGKRVLKRFDPAITQLIIYDRKKLSAKLDAIRIRKQIEKQGYAYVFCFENNPSYKRLVADISENYFNISDNDQHEHFAKRCLNVVQAAFDQPIRAFWAHLPVTNDAKTLSNQLLAEHNVHNNDIIIGMHPSFSGLRKSFVRSAKSRHIEHKMWPAECFAELARLIYRYAEEQGVPIKIIMDLLPDERRIGENIVELADNRIVLLTPEPNFERYKATIQRMDLLVTPDTGPMHIAAAVGTRLIALFAEKSPEDCGPYVAKNQYIALKAEDFSDIPIGLRAIPPEHVYAKCLELLNKAE
jgi:ADP-heptose:LPS heptosyltransferase